LMAQAGTNGTDGTDLTTTLTTQGDILYRDGSGLQRLGAGTAGQVLQSGGTGANPSWGTVSSDCVKLAHLEADGVSVTGIDVTGYFNDTLYHSYKFEISDLQFTAAANPMFSFLNSGGQINSSNYLVLHTGYQSGSGGSSGQQDRSYWNVGSTNDLEGTWGNYQNAGDWDYASMQGTIYNPQSTSVGKKMDYQFNSMSIIGGLQVVANGSFYHHSNSPVTGFRIRGHANNVRKYKMSLYGMKK